MTDLCASFPPGPQARARWLVWLGAGAREVAWALCSIPADRWTASPPPAGAGNLGTWPPARHVRHLVLAERHLLLPVAHALVDGARPELPARSELDELNAAWDPSLSTEAVGGLVEALAGGRFGLLQRLEVAPDAVWERPLPAGLAPGGAPAYLDWLLMRAHQHELEHLSRLWRLALYWDRPLSTPTTAPGVSLPLHPADRLEESH